jgi:hypothetical protein
MKIILSLTALLNQYYIETIVACLLLVQFEAINKRLTSIFVLIG